MEIVFFLCMTCLQPLDYQISELAAISERLAGQVGANIRSTFTTVSDTWAAGPSEMHVTIAPSICEQTETGLGVSAIDMGKMTGQAALKTAIANVLRAELPTCEPGGQID